MSYYELGFLSIFIKWAAFAYMLTKWHGNRTMSLSLHAASTRNASYYFAVVSLLTGFLFYIFMLNWFIPTYRLPSSFSVILSIAMLCLLVTALIPDKKGMQQKIHRFFAYSLASLLPIMVIFILTSCIMNFFTQLISGFVLAYMIFSILGFAFFKRLRKHYLIFQVAYIVVFDIFILVASYLR